MSRRIFVDTETTSLDIRRGEVWEIGFIVRDPGQSDIEYLWQLRPSLTYADPISLNIGRFYQRCVAGYAPGALTVIEDNDEINEPVTAGTIANTIAKMVNGAHIIGAVPDFDVRFLTKFLREYDECWTAHYHLQDIETMAIGYLRGLLATAGDKADSDVAALIRIVVDTLPWKYSYLLKLFGVHVDEQDIHTALGDARAVRDLYDKIVAGEFTLDCGMALTA